MAESADNPFESPQAAPSREEPTAPAYRQRVKRPVTPMVFGVLSIVFGAWGILGSIVGMAITQYAPGQQEAMAQMGYSQTYTLISQAAGLLLSALLLWAGIGLVRYRDSARSVFNVYAYINIVVLIANTLYVCVYVFPNANFGADMPANVPMRSIMIASTIFGAVASLIFPVLGLVFLNRQVVKEHLS